MKKIIFIFLFTMFFFSVHNVYAATKTNTNSNKKAPVNMLTKKYTRATWSVKCVNAGGDCILNTLYSAEKDNLKLISNADCESKKDTYTCVERKANNGKFLCTRCSLNYGCIRVSFYVDKPPGTSESKECDTKDLAAGYETTANNRTFDGSCLNIAATTDKTQLVDNSACKTTNGCTADSSDCVVSPVDSNKYTESSPSVSCTTTDGKEGKCAKSKAVTNVANASKTCISPNQCMMPGTSNTNNSGTSCTLNGSVFQMTYCAARRTQVQNGITGCMIANQFIPVPCDYATFSNGTDTYGINGILGTLGIGGMNSSLCQNGGTPVVGSCNVAGQICCSQASNPLTSAMQGLMSNISGLMNKIFNPSATNSSSSYLNTYLSPTPYNTPTPHDTPTPYPTSTPFPTPTSGSLNNPNGVDVTFNMKIKFQGIIKPKSELNKLKVKVTLVDTQATSGTKTALQEGEFTIASIASNSADIQVSSGSAGIWTGSVTFAKVEPKQGYRLLIKGPKHVQKKICTNSPTETYPGEYSCTDLLNVVAGNNDIDLSNIYIMSGDVPKQDGIVNSVDFGAVRTRFGKLDYTSIDTADLNLDGAVNSLDFSLIIQTLQTTDGVDQK